MPDFLTLDDIPCHGKTVLVRTDLNVPVKDGRITDTTRLERQWPTMKELMGIGAKIVLLSHFERPGGKPDPAFSLRPIAGQIAKLWDQPIAFVGDCIGPKAADAIAALGRGKILVLENTRFHPGEEANDLAFAKEMAVLGEVYVNDAFSVAHRANASTSAIAQCLPACAGRLMQQELQTLGKALAHNERPTAAIIGGAKISTKLDLLKSLSTKADLLILGGAMANTFLAAKGIAIGASRHEPDMLDAARDILAFAEQRGCHIMLPVDVVTAAELKAGATAQTCAVNAIPGGQMILDLGPKTITEIKTNLASCRTVLWNGPLGVFEIPPFDKATTEIATTVSDLTKRGKLLSVAGGGDTAAALAHAKALQGISYLSTGGGAFLEWLEGKELPAITALKNAVPKPKTGKAIL